MSYRLVLDASAVAKWFLEEDESIEMRRVRDLYVKDGVFEIYVPKLLLIELANLLRYAENLSSDDVVNAVKALRAIHINIVDDENVLYDAVETAFRTDVTIYDALYISLAKKLNAKLLTYDDGLHMKFREFSLKASELLSELSM